MSRFNALETNQTYLLIDGETGHSLTDGIAGADAMAEEWPAGAEAWPAGENQFDGSPVEIAE